MRFARDYRLLTRRAGVARDHRTLERACRLAAMIRKNPPPPESAEVCYRIARECFDATSSGIPDWGPAKVTPRRS
jgi:hypothetical protein